MIRIVTVVATALLAAGVATAQDINGNVASGFASRFGNGFSGDIRSGLQSRFGRKIGGSADTDDVTLGSSGGFTQSTLNGQPSNFGPSVQSMSSIAGPTLTFDNGPAGPLEFGGGPSGPLD